MASQADIPGFLAHHFEPARTKLSDELVGLVLPRASASGWNSAVSRGATPDHGGRPRSVRSREEPRDHHPSRKRFYDEDEEASGFSSGRGMDSIMNQDAAELKRRRIKAEVRREQCRTNQARYRNKQRNLQLQLEGAVKHLREELSRLKRQRQKILLAEKTDKSPWTIVTEVFRILENSFRSPWNLEREEDMQSDIEAKRNLAFLHQTFTSDVAVGEVRGIDKVIEQWRLISQYFGGAQLQLHRVELAAPGAITTSARLRFVVTELTLRYIFPNLPNVEPQSKYDIQPSLRDKLLGHHIDCSISVDFLFENENGRVVRVEPQIDMMPELIKILRDIRAVSEMWCSDEV
ncbi:hypothetical protein V7S43_017652 [Phytophthora oleae]|uniref:Bzip transcription factor n=1 Tax=Phytophthora oleae TaxID=2107226 RepID=A0ABD3EX00_9STRA